MKFSTTIILALASTLITASPLPISKRSPDSVLATINQWLNDISVLLPPTPKQTNPIILTPSQRVNAFLNTLALDDPNAAADGASALQFANDEPVQLSALAAVLSPTDTVGQNAVSVLMQVFPMVPAAFTVIAESGGDQSVVEAQVGIINSVRFVISLFFWLGMG
jgi:hypothetical protein